VPKNPSILGNVGRTITVVVHVPIQSKPCTYPIQTMYLSNPNHVPMQSKPCTYPIQRICSGVLSSTLLPFSAGLWNTRLPFLCAFAWFCMVFVWFCIILHGKLQGFVCIAVQFRAPYVSWNPDGFWHFSAAPPSSMAMGKYPPGQEPAIFPVLGRPPRARHRTTSGSGDPRNPGGRIGGMQGDKKGGKLTFICTVQPAGRACNHAHPWARVPWQRCSGRAPYNGAPIFGLLEVPKCYPGKRSSFYPFPHDTTAKV